MPQIIQFKKHRKQLLEKLNKKKIKQTKKITLYKFNMI